MYNQYTTVSISISKFFKDNKIALVPCYMKNALVFSESDARNFFMYIITRRQREKLPTNTHLFCRLAKRQKVEKELDYVSYFPYISFVLQLLPVASRCFTTNQSFEASLFVNVTHLILKGDDSRLKLLSFEILFALGQIGANSLNFTSYLHSAVVWTNETHQMMK